MRRATRCRNSRPFTLSRAAAALGLLVLLSAANAGFAETLTLQQGHSGYQGCLGKTLWEPKTQQPKSGVKDDVLYVRGTVAYAEKYEVEVTDAKTGKKQKVQKTRRRESGNRVLLRFELPAALAERRLALARLEVFVPEARNVRMINEILCREVLEPWSAGVDWESASAGRKWATPGGTRDTKTDYKRGRPAGAVDSYAFWEFNGRWFPHKYAFLSVPEGGRWIDFNITPLVRKWLADGRRNHGVALEPITQRDTRFPNRISIDLPSPASGDAARRPRMVLEFEPLAEPYRVGMTHGLRKFCDFSTRYRFLGPFQNTYEMDMARNEFEPFQVLVYPVKGPLKQVSFAWTDLTGPGGGKIPASDIQYNCQEWVKMHRNGKTRDWYFHGKEFWIPDPLSNPRPIDLPEHVATPFWFTVRTRPDTKPGVYRGTITVRPASAPPRTLQLTVKVWDYKIPERWNFQTMGQSNWGYFWRAYRGASKEKREQLRKRHIDFLMDHRFMPTEQYTTSLSPSLADIPYCVGERGGNTIYLNGNFKLPKDAAGQARALKSLRQRYDGVVALDEKLRAAGKLDTVERLIDMSLVYIGDETSDWELMRQKSNAIRKACPELMIMIGGSFPRQELDGVIDIYDPQIGGSSKTFSLTEEMTHKIAASQGRGERFFWYDAAGPMLPYPNVQCEDPLIASRVVFWMTWKYGVTGFEYYCYGIWSHNLPDKDGRRWPEKPFTPWGWGDTNGDGMLFYPGPDGAFSSVRFENIRDGIEDWESHFVLRDYLEALTKKGVRSPRADALIQKAKALLKVPDEIVKDMRNWTWEPEALLAARRELGQTISALGELVSEQEVLAVRRARQQSQLQRQREMLRRRADAARKAADALTPKSDPNK